LLNGDTLSVVGEDASPLAALNSLQSNDQQVDLIIYDQGDNSGEELIDLRTIIDTYPTIIVVILTAGVNARSLDKAIEMGAWAFLSNTISPEALKLVLQLLLLGENLFAAAGEVAGELESFSRKPMAVGDSDIRLSPRENAILELLGAGEPNKVIARKLNIAEATVKVHVKSLLRKINAGNRTQAAVWAINHPTARRNVAHCDGLPSMVAANRQHLFSPSFIAHVVTG
jgi:two-component system nitrate/nitrite response regulator NarL